MPPAEGSFTIPFSSVFESLVSCSSKCAQELAKAKDTAILREVFGGILGLLNGMAGRLVTQANLVWDPASWLNTLLESMDYEVRRPYHSSRTPFHIVCQSAIFTTADRIINLSVSLHRTTYLEPKLTIDDRVVMSKMVNKMLHYLRPEYTAYHVRSVNLIWSLESSVRKPYVESILAQSMTSAESSVSEIYEAFGVLWRLTGAQPMHCNVYSGN